MLERVTCPTLAGMIAYKIHPYTRLGVTAIIVILATRAVTSVLWSLLPELSPMWTYVLITCDLVLLTWQIRYGARIAKYINGFPLTWIIWAIILAVIAWTLNNTIDRISSLYQRPPEAAFEQAPLPVKNGIAIYNGEVDFEAFNALEETLKRSPDIHTLQLTSGGGRIAAARGMARLVTENQLDTRATGVCASACTLVFIAGTKRTLSENARLGFHGYELVSSIVTLSTNDEEARDKNTFASRGVSTEFLDRAFAVPHSDMWFPSREDLLNAGVINP